MITIMNAKISIFDTMIRIFNAMNGIFDTTTNFVEEFEICVESTNRVQLKKFLFLHNLYTCVGGTRSSGAV